MFRDFPLNRHAGNRERQAQHREVRTELQMPQQFLRRHDQKQHKAGKKKQARAMAARVQSQRGAEGEQNARKQAYDVSPLAPARFGFSKPYDDSNRGKNAKQTSRGQADGETRQSATVLKNSCSAGEKNSV